MQSSQENLHVDGQIWILLLKKVLGANKRSAIKFMAQSAIVKVSYKCLGSY